MEKTQGRSKRKSLPWIQKKTQKKQPEQTKSTQAAAPPLAVPSYLKKLRLKNFDQNSILSEDSELSQALSNLANSSLLEYPYLNTENIILSHELMRFTGNTKNNRTVPHSRGEQQNQTRRPVPASQGGRALSDEVTGRDLSQGGHYGESRQKSEKDQGSEASENYAVKHIDDVIEEKSRLPQEMINANRTAYPGSTQHKQAYAAPKGYALADEQTPGAANPSTEIQVGVADHKENRTQNPDASNTGPKIHSETRPAIYNFSDYYYDHERRDNVKAPSQEEGTKEREDLTEKPVTSSDNSGTLSEISQEIYGTKNQITKDKTKEHTQIKCKTEEEKPEEDVSEKLSDAITEDIQHDSEDNIEDNTKTQDQRDEYSLENNGSNTQTFKEDFKESSHSSFLRHSLNIDSIETASVTPRLICEDEYDLSVSLLDRSEVTHSFVDSEETKKVIAILEETLQQFNVEGKVVGIQRGPIITRFELKIAPGIKVNKILGLTDELAMALEALRVRIEAPIPGRSTIGIEIPNKKRAQVLLGDILRTEHYKDFEGKLPLPIGKDIAGNLVVADLTRLPHILIAGATGAGKSVLVNSFIVNYILKQSPENIRFLMIDPKLVELSQYNDIPHLLHPVITDPQKSIAALNWAVEEMERRYEDLSEARVRDITSYNERVRESNLRNLKNNSKGKVNTCARQGETAIYRDMLATMPYIIVLVDELGDLMMVAGKEVESSIIRLSQKARAVGIHLILATQRPSVDVITALIKANCPARIALQVAQKTDSRTILDSNGAEQLLGQGDSLFKHPSQGQLIRVQAPLVKDIEVEAVVEMAKRYTRPSYIFLEDSKGKASKLDTEEESLFEEAWAIILESQKASASYLQRRLRIGYNKAARLIEAFEARGYIGPQIGSKPREILLPD